MEADKQKDMRVIITLEAYRKLMAYVDLVDTEITGFADANWNDEKGCIVVDQVYLVKQEAQATEVEMDEEKIAEFTVDLIKQGVTQLPRCWWHSHVNMAVFWSGTDEGTIQDLQNDSFVLSIVVNKRREMYATLMIWKPVVLRIDDVPIEIEQEYLDIPEELIKEVQKKVKEKKYEQPKKGIVYGHSNNYDFGDDNDWGKTKSGIIVPGKKHRKKKGSNVQTLPKDRDRAREIIDRYDLHCSFDNETDELLYVSENRSIIWRDPWEDLLGDHKLSDEVRRGK